MPVDVYPNGLGSFRCAEPLGVQAQVAEAHYNAAVRSPAEVFVIRCERQYVAEHVAFPVHDGKARSLS